MHHPSALSQIHSLYFFTFALHKYVEEEAERVLEPVVIEDSKQIGLSRHSKTDKHMNSQLHRLCQMLSHC